MTKEQKLNKDLNELGTALLNLVAKINTMKVSTITSFPLKKKEENRDRHHGVVKWFNDAKGFGFITDNKTEQDLFVHFTAIQSDGFRSLTEGDRVSFEVVNGPKCLQAQDVRKE